MKRYYVRLIEIRTPYNNRYLGTRMIAGLNPEVTIADATCWQGDFIDPGAKEMQQFDKFLRETPYSADAIIWLI